MLGTADNFYDASDTGNPLIAIQPRWALRAVLVTAEATPARRSRRSSRKNFRHRSTSPRRLGSMRTIRRKASQIAITGRVGYRSAAQNADGITIDYVVEWAPGVDPTDTAFTKIGGADGITSEVNGALATWDISKVSIINQVLPVTDVHYQPDDPSEIFAATIRVRATVHTTSANRQRASPAKRGAPCIFIANTAPCCQNFPSSSAAPANHRQRSSTCSAPANRVIVAGDGGGFIHADQSRWHRKLPGWPVRTEAVPLLDPTTLVGKSHQTGAGFSTITATSMHAAIVWSAVAVGDIDGDKKPDIVAATVGGHVWAFHVDGSVVNGFPVAIDFSAAKLAVDANHPVADAISAAPVLADFDGHGVFSIVVASQEGKVYVWNGGGVRVSGFPVTDCRSKFDRQYFRHTAASAHQNFGLCQPAVGDVNGRSHFPRSR